MIQSFIGLEVFVLFKINFAFLSVQNSFPLCHRHAYLLLSFAHITAAFFPVPPPPPASFYPPPKYTLSAFMSYVRMHGCIHAHMGGCISRLHMWEAMCNIFLSESHLFYLKWCALSYMQMAFHSPLLTNKIPLCIFTIFSSPFHLRIGF